MQDDLHILIVDDDADTRFQFKHLLEKHDSLTWHFTETSNSQEAFCAYKRRRFDCVLLDYSLPLMDGLETLKKLKEKDKYCPVVMVTGQGNEGVAVEAMKLGASDYLSKDWVNSASMHRAVSHAVENATLVRKVAAQRNELENFARILAHDLKDPLCSAITFTEIMQKKSREGCQNAVDDYAHLISKSCGHMNELIDTLFQYTHEDVEGVFETLSLLEVARQAIHNLSVEIEAQGAKVVADYDMPQAYAHKVQLVQLLQNLVANSLKYCVGKRAEIRISAAVHDDCVHLTVSDNGIGIPENELKHIFEPFVQLDGRATRASGTGLGLATCKKIVKRHGGTIWCTSEEGRGSQFHVTLPAKSTMRLH